MPAHDPYSTDNATTRRSSAQLVLVTRLRFLVDVVMSTPVLETLRERLPNARIEYLTYAPCAPALYHHPAVDRIHTLPARPGLRATLSAVRRLRSPRIDWWIDLFGNPRSVVLMTLSRPRHSVGPDRGFRTAPYEHRRPMPPDSSAVRHHLDKLDPLLGPVPRRRTRLYVTPGERESVADRLGLDRRRELFLIHPGATWPARAWPVERWPELARRLRETTPAAQLRVITPPGQEARSQRIAALCGGEVRTLPRLELRGLLALLSCGSLYIGNDGGVLHSAVALGVPSVGLFGPTDPAAWFPYCDWGPYRVVQKDRAPEPDRSGPEASRLREMSVADVLEAVLEVRELARSHRADRLNGILEPAGQGSG